MIRDRNKSQSESPVLLVCIYNQFGNIITHDYLYQLFSPFGNIIKILIFQKAKVWKTFVEYDDCSSAAKAMQSLNNKVVFEDGGKMNIFRSKLKHIQLQNTNLGGVNYQDLKEQQYWHEQSFQNNRRRRSTFQDYIQPVFQHQKEQNIYEFAQKDFDLSSTSAKYKSESLSAKNSIKGGSLNNFASIDQQFRQIALQSQEYRDWQEKQELNRKKSKTIVNPNSQQFLIENCPSKVLFVRSLPENFNNECIYNIFSNFGKICKVIYIKEKNSALVEYETLMNAIQAKDQINYAKSEFRVFYSHYQSLILRKVTEDEEELQYKSQGVSNKSNSFNPPTEVLYLTLVHPNLEEEIRQRFKTIGCEVKEMDWKQNGKDKWMCLAEFRSLADSLFVMGKLQGAQLSNGKNLRLSFTRSKIKRKQKMPKFYETIREHDQYL